MTSDLPLLRPEWPAPETVRALCTTRQGGVSRAPWGSFNLGLHVGDSPAAVAQNRTRLSTGTGLPASAIGWLDQVHGTSVVELTPDNVDTVPVADASYTRHAGLACAILTADCLPVVLCDRRGQVVGAAHAGWRSLCSGVLENLIGAMRVPGDELLAWLGPAIGPERFEVGPEVRDAFVSVCADDAAAFSSAGARPGHYLADLYQLATHRLTRVGVCSIQGGGWCTVSEREQFFSFRRDGQTGRMATLIWRT